MKAAGEEATLRRIALRLLPFLMGAYFLAFVDRVNAGFAALQMNQAVGLTPALFGLGGGLFFLGYVICEVPSNLLLVRFGARRWIARILFTWGAVAAAMALIEGPRSFLGLRFALGVAEAGFFPGVITYLTYWFPAQHRARIVALFMVAIPVSSLIGSPISAALLGLDGWLGVAGWRWMFLLEGAPAVAMGLAALAWLPDSPASARWLTPAEKTWLEGRLAGEAAAEKPVGALPLWRVLSDRHVLAAALVYAGSSGASACLTLWGPQILKSFGLGLMATGWLNALPAALAVAAMLMWGSRSDRTGERLWHTAAPLALTAMTLAAAPLTHGLAAIVAVISLATMGAYAVKGPFWALATGWLSAAASAPAVAQINAIGNLGAFVATWSMGLVKGAGGSYALGLLPIAAVGLLSTLTIAAFARAAPTRSRRASQEGAPG